MIESLVAEMSQCLSSLYLTDKAAVSLDSPETDYVIHLDLQTRVDRSSSAKIACSSSNYTVRLFSRAGLAYSSTLTGHTKPISGIKFCENNPSLLYTASLDGTLRCWDLRYKGTEAAITMEGYEETNNVFTSFDLSCDSRLACAGSEATKGGDVHLTFWDVRKTCRLGVYQRSHNDDITQVRFHPTKPDVLLTGSVDGLICVFDVSQPCEGDALLSTLNTESTVSQAGWSGEDGDKLYGITHTNALHVWDSTEFDPILQVEDIINPLLEPDKPCNLGKERMDYLVDCFYGNQDNLFLLAGSNSGQLSVCRVSDDGLHHQVSLTGGHTDVVRCLCWDKETESLITSGEDAMICLWTREQVKLSHNRDSRKAKSALKTRHKHKRIP